MTTTTLHPLAAETCVIGDTGPEHCTGGVSPALGIFMLAIAILAPIATAIYLARRAR